MFRYFTKAFFISVFLCSFFQFSLAQQALDLFEEDQDIPCEELSSAFKSYSQDSQLNSSGLNSALKETLKFLNKHSQSKQIPALEMSQMIESLSEAVSLSQSNNLSFLERSDNISYSLKSCL